MPQNYNNYLLDINITQKANKTKQELLLNVCNVLCYLTNHKSIHTSDIFEIVPK